jgi:hypothetical protein
MINFLKASPKIILAPLVLIGTAALGLYLLGLVQDYLHPPEHGPREYTSIEAAEADLGFQINVPTYFPSYIAWPPARITGQLLPVPQVETDYHSLYGAKVLVILQIASDSGEPPDVLPWVRTITEEAPITIEDNTGVMIAATDADGQPLKGAYWKSDDFFYVVITSHSERELLTIVRSM